MHAAGSTQKPPREGETEVSPGWEKRLLSVRGIGFRAFSFVFAAARERPSSSLMKAIESLRCRRTSAPFGGVEMCSF